MAEDDQPQEHHPIDEVEMRHGMTGIAAGARAFYEGLVAEGFDNAEALRLTSAWVAGIAGGKIG